MSSAQVLKQEPRHIRDNGVVHPLSMTQPSCFNGLARYGEPRFRLDRELHLVLHLDCKKIGSARMNKSQMGLSSLGLLPCWDILESRIPGYILSGTGLGKKVSIQLGFSPDNICISTKTPAIGG